MENKAEFACTINQFVKIAANELGVTDIVAQVLISHLEDAIRVVLYQLGRSHSISVVLSCEAFAAGPMCIIREFKYAINELVNNELCISTKEQGPSAVASVIGINEKPQTPLFLHTTHCCICGSDNGCMHPRNAT